SFRVQGSGFSSGVARAHASRADQESSFGVSRFSFLVSSFALFRTPHSPLRTRERAIALIIVMIVIFVLTGLAAHFAFQMKVETKLAQNANNETELQWLGRSGIQYCRWVLSVEASTCPQMPDSLNSVWAGGSGNLCATNPPLSDVQHEVHLGNGY